MILALPGGLEYFPGKDEGNRDESVEDPDFPGMYLPSVGQLYDILRNLGKADMMIFLDSYVEKFLKLKETSSLNQQELYGLHPTAGHILAMAAYHMLQGLYRSMPAYLQSVTVYLV